jgi:hypothetical protein
MGKNLIDANQDRVCDTNGRTCMMATLTVTLFLSAIKNIPLFLYFKIFKINLKNFILLVFLDYFDALILKIIFKK